MRRVLFGLVAVMSLVVGSVAAQQPPNFSGGWSATRDAPPGVPAAPTAVFGAKFWIAQEPKSVVFTRPLRDTAVATTHTTDGKESDNYLPGATCLGDPIITTAVTISGAELVFATVSQRTAGATSPTPRGLNHTFKLVSPDTLVVETTMRTAAQGEPTTVATVYKKTTEPVPAVAAAPVKVAAARLSQMSWLAGAWMGSNATTTSEERWSPAVGGSMHAVSRTLSGGGTSISAFEFLCIAERFGGLVYTAMPNARTPATDFFLTAIDTTSATFENPSHDFPKKIRYALRPDGTLEAVVSGAEGQRSFTLTFKKQN